MRAVSCVTSGLPVQRVDLIGEFESVGDVIDDLVEADQRVGISDHGGV